MSIDPIISDVIHYTEEVMAELGFDPDPLSVCEKLGIQLYQGARHLAYRGEQDVVLTAQERYGTRQMFSIAHELAHILLKRGGYLRLIHHHHAQVKDMRRHIEMIANHLAGIILMPAPRLYEAKRLYGETPGAVLYLMEKSAASEQAAMLRWTWQDVEEARGSFIASDRYISCTASCNLWLPFKAHDRVPEIHISHPEVELLLLPDGRKMGTVIW